MATQVLKRMSNMLSFYCSTKPSVLWFFSKEGLYLTFMCPYEKHEDPTRSRKLLPQLLDISDRLSSLICPSQWVCSARYKSATLSIWPRPWTLDRRRTRVQRCESTTAAWSGRRAPAGATCRTTPPSMASRTWWNRTTAPRTGPRPRLGPGRLFPRRRFPRSWPTARSAPMGPRCATTSAVFRATRHRPTTPTAASSGTRTCGRLATTFRRVGWKEPGPWSTTSSCRCRWPTPLCCQARWPRQRARWVTAALPLRLNVPLKKSGYLTCLLCLFSIWTMKLRSLRQALHIDLGCFGSCHCWPVWKPLGDATFTLI